MSVYERVTVSSHYYLHRFALANNSRMIINFYLLITIIQ